MAANSAEDLFYELQARTYAEVASENKESLSVEKAMMVRHEIIADGEELSVRVYDGPAGGWRLLFVQKDGAIARYTSKDYALTGAQIYNCADKTALCDAEIEAYLASARTGRPLGECGLSSVVRFGEPDHHVYATFTLPEDFIRRSSLMIIGYKRQEPIYSTGWEITN